MLEDRNVDLLDEAHDRVAAAGPQRVLDVATGPAGIALAVAARTRAQVVGVDLNEPMLRAGAANVRRGGRGDAWRLVGSEELVRCEGRRRRSGRLCDQ